jgi:malonate transporter and related proteins
VQGLLEGFVTLGAVIALGALLAHVGVLDLPAQVMLARLAFFVASPALLFTVLAEADVTEVLSRNLVASAAGVVVSASVYLILARYLWRRDVGHMVIGTLSSAYVNAGNLGLPIAAYVLGDAALIAPMLLMQLLVLQPIALAILDTVTSRAAFSTRRLLARTATNPLTVGTLLGVVVAFTGVDLPLAVTEPLDLVGGMAVPAVLLAYGVSLRLGPRPGAGGSTSEIAAITVLKLVVQPTVGYLVARFALGLEGLPLLAVTVTAALPTAQNIFVHATRYDRAPTLARDAIFATTVLSVPALVVIVALLA